MNWEMAKEVGVATYIARRVRWRWLRKRAQGSLAFRLPNGTTIQLPIDSPFASDIFCTGGYVDWGSEQLLLSYLDTRPKAICIDVGANMGYYSCLLASHATEVVAFEPDPRNHAPLLAQGLANVTLVPQAVSNTVGSVSFDVSSASTVSHLCFDGKAGRQITVAATTLDAYWVSHLGRRDVSAIKMDVEGFEILGLEGAGELTAAVRPVFLIEFGMEEGMANSVEALESFLSRHDYELATMIRYAAGRWGYRTVLESVAPPDLTRRPFKMLFLIPRETTFFREAQRRAFQFESMRRDARRLNGGRRETTPAANNCASS